MLSGYPDMTILDSKRSDNLILCGWSRCRFSHQTKLHKPIEVPPRDTIINSYGGCILAGFCLPFRCEPLPTFLLRLVKRSKHSGLKFMLGSFLASEQCKHQIRIFKRVF